MDDIFSLVRDGNAFQVRIWLDNTENDLNQGDGHGFSLLHWACMEGKTNIVEMLLNRGVRVNATNMGDDTALHLAAAHGHLDIVLMLLQSKANVSVANEHGNTPLHYACFWNFERVAEELVKNNAPVNIENKFGETPLDKAKISLAHELAERARSMGQDMQRIEYRDRSWLGYKTRTKDATLSRHSGIDLDQLNIQSRISANKAAELWRGTWQDSEIAIKILNIRQCTARMFRDFKDECSKLRIFNHPNVLPLLGACNQPPNLVLVSQYMPLGSLFDVLHAESGIVVDQHQCLNFALDIARGMEFLHTMDPLIPNIHLNSGHVLIDEDFTCRINLSSYKFSFHQRGREMYPAWMAPEALQKPLSDINQRAADMWSFAIILWELQTRDVPFAELSPMEAGMKIALEGLRVSTSTAGSSAHMERLIKICMNEDPGKRPRFDMVVPILNKMKISGS
ncbi:hypothetical protein HELRODRAFT_115085 [Helobdella robusta]|uniref:Protein kinase domain-containing protein n=1 Tax=Helobdella robusta TaxID=6412 RepID=T1EG62_HELRO|nr:hypothetical protein HELRODRAFT_115085 [Helobdella robusta]ESN94756.1 hypothetical protein HELRODRAFT_115085 [Helobdella robusta]